MGWRFPIKYANIAAYITVRQTNIPPRITAWEMREFLGSVQGEYRDKPPLISTDESWIDNVVQAAKEASDFVRSLNKEGLLEIQEIERALVELRRLLGNYKLFGLPVGGWNDSKELRSFVEYAAYSSRHHAIFLIPDFDSSNIILDVLDPFPPIALLTEQPENWPGILFWSCNGAAAFAPLQDAYRLYQDLLESFDSGAHRIDSILGSYHSHKQSKKLLQLSDLHFGTANATENEAYVSGHLQSVARSVNRVVITGDLFDNPTREDALTFRNFRASLTRLTGKEVIVIPGNHDQKVKGNTLFYFFGRRLKELSNLEWTNLIIDDEMQCVFFCFDTSRDADLARGKITTQQMMEVATLFETEVATKPQYRDYLSVALIHHHPFSFETESETFIQRGLSLIGLTDEYFLRMENAEAFLIWCAKRNIPLILHGHKHVPRHVNRNLEYEQDGKSVWRRIAAIGCGASLGVERRPLSYNILTWDSVSKNWSVSFFADPGDGSGFVRQYVALHSA